MSADSEATAALLHRALEEHGTWIGSVDLAKLAKVRRTEAVSVLESCPLFHCLTGRVAQLAGASSPRARLYGLAAWPHTAEHFASPAFRAARRLSD